MKQVHDKNVEMAEDYPPPPILPLSDLCAKQLQSNVQVRLFPASGGLRRPFVRMALSKSLDFALMASSYSPNRENRPPRVGDMDKVTGGVFLLNHSGQMATLGFCFTDKEQTGTFGLTVAHLVRQIGDVVYMFDGETDPLTQRPTIGRVGTVVEISPGTDSAVFKIDEARAPHLRTRARPTHTHIM